MWNPLVISGNVRSEILQFPNTTGLITIEKYLKNPKPSIQKIGWRRWWRWRCWCWCRADADEDDADEDDADEDEDDHAYADAGGDDADDADDADDDDDDDDRIFW